jgi:hypothetical protein
MSIRDIIIEAKNQARSMCLPVDQYLEILDEINDLQAEASDEGLSANHVEKRCEAILTAYMETTQEF